MKILYILIDGVSDRPDKRLNNLTPLEASFTPNLDFFSRRSKAGYVITVKEGISPESDLAVLNMLGYSFKEYFGRGVIEALGANMNFRDGELALRGNFATVDDELNIVDRRAGRNIKDEEAKELVEELKAKLEIKGVDWDIKHTVGHRVVLVFRAKEELGAKVTNIDPAYQRDSKVSSDKIMKVKEAEALDEKSKLSAKILNEFTKKSYEILKDSFVNKRRKEKGLLPANIILLRDASNSIPKLPSMKEKYNLNFACIAEMPVELGIAKLTGMEAFKIDEEKMAKKALDLLKEYDGVYLHIKGPDEFGHDGEPLKKKESIEKIDKDFFGNIMNVDLYETALIISADHSTPCQLRAHSDDPVPLIICNEKLIKDKVCRFTEREVKKGSLGLMYGKDVLKKALEILS